MDEFELSSSDAGEVLTLQRAAFASEAQLYGGPFLPALGADHFEIFTGHLSEGNIRLYEREGFATTGHNEILPGITLVFMTK